MEIRNRIWWAIAILSGIWGNYYFYSFVFGVDPKTIPSDEKVFAFLSACIAAITALCAIVIVFGLIQEFNRRLDEADYQKEEDDPYDFRGT